MFLGYSWVTIAATALAALLLSSLVQAIVSVYFSPLSQVPGPKFAAATVWYRAYLEPFKGVSWTDHLAELHSIYGDVVRVGPNELHFARPSAYHEIYHNSLRWDKEETLYQSFGEDRSSFGFLTYDEAKERKNVLQPLFSRRAVIDMQGLLQDKIDRMCDALKKNDENGKSSDLFYAFRCFTTDVITSFCFARCVDAISVPDFHAPLVVALEAAGPAFVVLRNFPLIRRLIFSLPPWLSDILSPEMAGLGQLQRILHAQLDEAIANPKSLENAPHPIIYHELLKPGKNGGEVPVTGSLYEEAQALVFAGSETVGNTLMLGMFHTLENPPILSKVKEEILQAWPVLGQPPTFEKLEKLPYLTALIKESQRVSPGVMSPLPRMVPHGGATISGTHVPGNTVVGMSGVFLHDNKSLFPDPYAFKPERWLGPDSKSLENWLVPFSRGPRMCLGQNLAWCELYIAFAAIFRRFDMTLDDVRVSDLSWRDCFLPHFQGKHLQAFCKPVEQ